MRFVGPNGRGQLSLGYRADERVLRGSFGRDTQLAEPSRAVRKDGIDSSISNREDYSRTH